MTTLILFGICLILALYAAIYWRRNKQSIHTGFGFVFGTIALRDIAAGFLICLIAMVGIFLVELLLGAIRVTGAQFSLDTISNGMSMFVFGAVLEELFFRSFMLSGLAILLGGRKWIAIALTAIVFGAVHLGNPGASLVSAFGNALGGVIYGMAFLGGKNIWLPLGLHVSWNFSQGTILGFPVSGQPFPSLVQQQTTGADLLTGGAYGPEAGLVGIIFRFVVMALLIAYLRQRAHGPSDLARLSFPISEHEHPSHA